MKDNPITIGFDDATFELKKGDKTTPLIGVVCQGTRIVRVMKKEIFIDGNDSTDALIELIKKAEKHVQYILTDAITFGGFNIADLKKVYEETGKPIISVTEREVRIEAVKAALLKKFPDTYNEKMQLIENAGELHETMIETAGGPAKVYFHCIGVSVGRVKELLEKVCIDSKAPEPVRLAHIIGRMFNNQ